MSRSAAVCCDGKIGDCAYHLNLEVLRDAAQDEHKGHVKFKRRIEKANQA